MTIISKSALAAELGISPARVSQYLKSGMPERADGRLDRETALSWIAANIPGGDDPGRGAALAAEKVRKRSQRRNRAVANPLRVPPPPFLQPVDECSNPFEQGFLLAVLTMHRELFTIGALAAFEVGATAEAAEEAGKRAECYFVQQASELMRGSQIGPFRETLEAPIWEIPHHPKIDWTRLADEPESKQSRAKWGNVPSS